MMRVKMMQTRMNKQKVLRKQNNGSLILWKLAQVCRGNFISSKIICITQIKEGIGN
jgi:hypothetical protein